MSKYTDKFPLTVVYKHAGKWVRKRFEEPAASAHLAKRQVLERYLRNGVQVKEITIEYAGA